MKAFSEKDIGSWVTYVYEFAGWEMEPERGRLMGFDNEKEIAWIDFDPASDNDFSVHWRGGIAQSTDYEFIVELRDDPAPSDDGQAASAKTLDHANIRK